ncbi:EAL domain-containing protein [Nitrosospira briensis]|uniref:EAL domain-containing protein n=1 Tax=Nitrosospira briensis TaxID=35799 RepID=UPI00046AEEA9|nr:EAL domain-containing protein [Nitrosospira briensis]
MSLLRQLRLTVILVTLASFTGSFAISLLSARSYLEQQLHQKNIDSANSLAHSISQLSKDTVTIGLQIGALFDSGQYETISITSPDGRVIAERIRDRKDGTVPEWFIDLFPVSAEAGIAQISDGWMHFGVIKVAANAQFAYQALWDQTGTLLIWFLAAGIFCGLIGILILQRIKKPLAAMVEQAEAITERRFLTISDSRIPELRTIAHATNDMIRRLHNRAIEEASRMESVRKLINYDPVTGLANRAHFMNRFLEILDGKEGEGATTDGNDKDTVPGKDSEDMATTQDVEDAALIHDGKDAGPGGDEGGTVPSVNDKDIVAVAKTKRAQGVLFLVRINNLEEINQKLGRDGTNSLLREVGRLIGNIAGRACDSTVSDPLAARLNGSDFVLVIPDIDDTSQIVNQLAMELAVLSSKIDREITDLYHIGAVRYQGGDKLGELLGNADLALTTAERTGINAWHLIAAQPDQLPAPVVNIGDWRNIFSDALAEDRFKLVLYPVIGPTGAPLHQEAFVRMQAQHNGGWLEASDFVNIAARLNLTGPLDLAVIRHGLETLQSLTGDLAINLSIETIADWDFRNKLAELLRQYPNLCQRLWIEVPEYGAYRKFEAFRDFCYTFKELGCRIGIEHFGHHFAELRELTGLGLDYIKIDASFVHGIHQNRNNQKFLKGLCRRAHSIRIIAIADGVQTEAERQALIKLGFDGVTGPGIK